MAASRMQAQPSNRIFRCRFTVAAVLFVARTLPFLAMERDDLLLEPPFASSMETRWEFCGDGSGEFSDG